MSRNYVELKALLKIVELALNEISAVKAREFRLSSSFVFAKAAKSDPEYDAYKLLKEELQKQINDLKKGSISKSAAQSTAPSGKSSISINNVASSNNPIPSIIEEVAASPVHAGSPSTRRGTSGKQENPQLSALNEVKDDNPIHSKNRNKSRPSFGASMIFQLSYTDKKLREKERNSLSFCSIS